MTIDEAIKKHKKLKILAEGTNDKRGAFYSAEQHEQIAEWLEDYKRIKMLIPIEQALKNEYNKAIDDFASELENHSIYADIGKGDEVKMEWVSPVTRIKEIAEQLKAGEKE